MSSREARQQMQMSMTMPGSNTSVRRSCCAFSRAPMTLGYRVQFGGTSDGQWRPSAHVSLQSGILAFGLAPFGVGEASGCTGATAVSWRARARLRPYVTVYQRLSLRSCVRACVRTAACACARVLFSRRRILRRACVPAASCANGTTGLAAGPTECRVLFLLDGPPGELTSGTGAFVCVACTLHAAYRMLDAARRCVLHLLCRMLARRWLQLACCAGHVVLAALCPRGRCRSSVAFRSFYAAQSQGLATASLEGTMRPLPAKAKIRGLRDSRVIPTGANCASTHALMDALIHARARTHVRARMHALRSPHPLEQPHMYVHVHECMRSDGLGPDRCQTEDLRWRSSRCHHGRRRRSCPTRQRLVSAAARIGMRERVRARASTAPTPACGYRCADCTWLRTCTHGVRGGSGLPIDGSYCAFPACHRLRSSSTSSTTCRRRRRRPAQTAPPMYACCSTAQTRGPLAPADARCASKVRGRVGSLVCLFTPGVSASVRFVCC